jgi:hypothetical protein
MYISSSNKDRAVSVELTYLKDPSNAREIFAPFFAINDVKVSQEGVHTVMEICHGPRWGPPGATTKKGGFVRNLDDHVIDMLVDVMSHAEVKSNDAVCYAYIGTIPLPPRCWRLEKIFFKKKNPNLADSCHV